MTQADEGISGTDESRPGLTDMLATISNINDIAGVVVLNTSRLWRDDVTKVFVRKQLTKLGVAVYSIEQPTYNVNTKDPGEFLFNGMMELLDQYERMEIVLKLDKGRKTKARSGSKASGAAPIGYRWLNKSIVTDEYYALIISGIFYKVEGK